MAASRKFTRLQPGDLDPSDRSRFDAYVAAMAEPMAALEKRPKQLSALIDTLKSMRASKPVEDEIALLFDTVSDVEIMTSLDVSSPAHAIELKRFGLNPCRGGRVGQFTDVHLESDLNQLGSGNQNTVSIVTYILPGGRDRYKGVFKPEKAPIDAVGGGNSGIDEKHPRVGYRRGSSMANRANALGRHLIANPDALSEDGESLTDSVVGRLVENAVRASTDGYPREFSFDVFRQNYPGLHRGLERDGFTVEDGQLRRALPEALDLPQADDESK